MVADAVVSRRSMTLWTLAGLLHLQAVPALLAATMPTPVSPGAAQTGALTESRCPTFSWGGVAGAPGYELVVFRVREEGTEPELVARVSLPADSRGWTPSVGQCLVRGERYAWSIAAVTAEGSDREREWAPALLFEIEAAGDGAVPRPEVRSPRLAAAGGAIAETAGLEANAAVRDQIDRASQMAPVRSAPHDLAGAGTSEATADTLLGRALIVRAVSQASTPSFGPASLAVSQQIHLGAASDLFKDGDVFLWDDVEGNTALGRASLASVNGVNGSATGNTAFGHRALELTTGSSDPFEGSYNTAVGAFAMRKNVLGGANTATGFAALNANTDGYHNTATGFFALRANVDGTRNTATGHYALGSNVGGGSNTAAGWEALRSNTSGLWNTAVGVAALHANTTGNRNTGVGVHALSASTTACCNTAIGTSALQYNTTGGLNTASGDFSLLQNTTGSGNSAHGQGALLHNTTGNHDVALGVAALYHNVTGSRNVASGAYALAANTAGDRNTAIGARALSQLASGQRNTAIGDDAGLNLTSGSYNIFVNNLGAGTEDRTIRIGTQGTQLATLIAGIHGHPVAAGSEAAVLVDPSGRLGTVLSSRAFKQDIQDLRPVADRLLELRPVSFRFKESAAANADSPRQFGLIAEEVAEVFPELVVFDAAGKPLTVKYHLLSSLLLAALQRQHAQLEDQARLVRQREEESASMRARLAAIEAQVGRSSRDVGRRARDSR